MGDGDCGGTDLGLPDGPRDGSAHRESDSETSTGIRHGGSTCIRHRQRVGGAAGSRQHSLVTDGGRNRERPLSERSRESIDAELEDLQQDPEQYETRDQAVIDRYEGLLAERQRRQRAADAHRENQRRRRLETVKNKLLRVFGLR